MATFMFCCALASLALAGPGAHGPNGEHLDVPAQVASATSHPRMEAQSEMFELVADLHEDELSIMIDRFESNEPVLGAAVEVEVGQVKAKARFHADHGDYAVDDPALLKVLAQPGEHALVFTIIAGEDSDLLEGTLTVGDAHGADHHSHESSIPGIGIGIGALVLAAAGYALWRRRKYRSLQASRGQA